MRNLRACAALASLSLLARAEADAASFGLAFLEANAEAEGVVVLPSGLQYRALAHGGGETSPAVDSPIEVSWEGFTAAAFNATPRGAPFYSTYAGDGPMPLTPQEGVSAWEEALTLMGEGDRWELFVPAQLGYGEDGMEGVVEKGEALVYVLELAVIEGESKTTPRRSQGETRRSRRAQQCATRGASTRRDPEAELRAAEEALEAWDDLDGSSGGVGLARLDGVTELDDWCARAPPRPLVLAQLRLPLAGAQHVRLPMPLPSLPLPSTTPTPSLCLSRPSHLVVHDHPRHTHDTTITPF